MGANVRQEDVKARFEDGTLVLTFPKEEQKVVTENPHMISIEG